MKKEENTNFYQKLILIEDEIYESDILNNYDLFIRKCIDFAKKKIIPLSDNQKYLDDKIKLSIDFIEGRLSKSELIEASYQFTKEIYASSSNIKEKKIKYFICFLFDSDFLQNITPDEQQDSYISYLLSTLYEIQSNIVLCEEFYKFINKELS